MAEFRPFQGIRYNADVIADHSQVVAPPYDIISPAERDAFHDRHPSNVIRLILGQPHPDDDALNNVHTRAARFFRKWMAEQVLLRDELPGFYLTSVSFELEGRSITRHGITGMVRLEPFDKGIVLPHERTFSKVKSERLQLMKACHANLCPIFGLYSDAGGTCAKLRAMAADTAPDIELTDDGGLVHRLWRLTDAQVVDEVAQSLKARKIYIADGHHRYETALNYREWIKAQDPGFTPDHPCNYVMMSLVSMEDPGLVILPAHRLLLDVPARAVARFFESSPQYFDCQTLPVQEDMGAAADQVHALLGEKAAENAIGVYVRNRQEIQVMVPKPGIMKEHFGHEMHASLLDLDVSVLTHLMMMKLLGFDQDWLDDETKISYRTRIKDALAAVKENGADLCFLLNPTRIEQVKRVAEHGLIMPRKSTYFSPKEISGLVMNDLKGAK